MSEYSFQIEISPKGDKYGIWNVKEFEWRLEGEYVMKAKSAALAIEKIEKIEK